MNVPTPSRLVRYLTVVIRWLAITLVVFVLTILTGLYITDNLLPKVYTATAEIQINPFSKYVLPGPSPADSTGSGFNPIDFQSEFQIIESPELLLPVIYELGLDKAWAKRVDKSDSDDLPPQDALLPQDALAHMNKILKLDFSRGSNIINITVSSDVPEETAAIANAIADKYKTLRDVEEDQRNKRGQDALRDQIAQQQKVVDDAKAALGKISDHQSPGYQAAKLELGRQQSLLDAMNVRLQQIITDDPLIQSPVRIVSRAEVPTVPTKPDRHFAFLVMIVVGGVLSVMAASFVEIILLFLRAGERPGN